MGRSRVVRKSTLWSDDGSVLMNFIFFYIIFLLENYFCAAVLNDEML